MTFSQHIKTLKIQIVGDKIISVDDIFAQYNPDRFSKYRQTCCGKSRQVLHMQNSPHVSFLKMLESGKLSPDQYRGTDYYKMHRLYGKKHKWIAAKIDKFIGLYAAIRDGKLSLDDAPIILKVPVIPNKYNNKHEIWEGHHRVASYVMLGQCKINIKLAVARG